MTHNIPFSIEEKTLSFEIKSIDEDLGIVTGYLSTFNNVDYQKDRILPGAFKKTIQEALQRKTNKGRKYLFPLLWMHDPEKPIGGFINAEEDTKGLLVTAQLDIATNTRGIPNNPLATTVFSGYKSGYIDEFSIGYNAIQKDYDQDGVRNLKEVRVVEGSAVTMLMAANSEAQATSVKSASGSSDWPIAPRDTAWSKSKAIADIERATGGDWSKAGKYFFWTSGDPKTEADCKMPFVCEVGGSMKAVPHAIFSCGAILSGAMNSPELGGDTAAVKSRVAGYYDRMAKQFGDPTIKAPWEDKTATNNLELKIQQLEQALARLQSYIGEDIKSMDIKAGRAISAANATRLAGHAATLNQMSDVHDQLAQKHAQLAKQHQAMSDQHQQMGLQTKAIAEDVQALLGTPENFDGNPDTADVTADKSKSEPLSWKALAGNEPGKSTQDIDLSDFEAFFRSQLNK